jgi:hypothetical protein
MAQVYFDAGGAVAGCITGAVVAVGAGAAVLYRERGVNAGAAVGNDQTFGINAHIGFSSCVTKLWTLSSLSSSFFFMAGLFELTFIR